MRKIFSILAFVVCVISILPTGSCTKTTTIRDTTVIIDTVPPADTTYKHINDSLWAYYPLNGNLGDSSGNNHALTLVGAGATLGYDFWGNPTGALDFTSGSSYGEIADGANFNAPNFTVSLFVMYRTIKGYLFNKIDYTDATGATFNIAVDPPNYGDTVRFAINGDDSTTCTNTPHTAYTLKNTVGLQSYAWYHLVATFSNGVAQFYINGALITTQTIPFQQLNECSNAPFILGNWWSMDNGSSLDGKIDELRIYSRVLSPHEVNYLFNNFSSR